MIREAIGKNELPTAASFVDKRPKSLFLGHRRSTINDREPLPMKKEFIYKSPMDNK